MPMWDRHATCASTSSSHVRNVCVTGHGFSAKRFRRMKARERGARVFGAADEALSRRLASDL